MANDSLLNVANRIVSRETPEPPLALAQEGGFCLVGRKNYGADSPKSGSEDVLYTNHRATSNRYV